jgi:hypothetical protein
VTTIEITLPDALAEEAKGAGLLSPEAIEDLLRSKLASDRLNPVVPALARLLAVMERSFCAAFKPDVTIDSIGFSAIP